MRKIDLNGRGRMRPEEPVEIEGWFNFVELHDSTSPEVIRKDQRQEILAIYNGGISDPDGIANCAILPISIVRQRLAELGLGPAVKRILYGKEFNKDRAASLVPSAARALSGKSMMTSELADELGIGITLMHAVLRSSDKFVSARRSGRTNKRKLFWSLA